MKMPNKIKLGRLYKRRDDEIYIIFTEKTVSQSGSTSWHYFYVGFEQQREVRIDNIDIDYFSKQWAIVENEESMSL